MNILQKLIFRKSKRSGTITEYRNEWFRYFLGTNTKGYEDEYPVKYESGWRGNTPEEAMKLADKVVAWLFSPLKT